MKRKIAIGLGLLGLIVSSAAVGGLWPGFPVVGGAAYCSSYSGTAPNTTCISTIPAGPTGVTGNEYVPADTNLAQGAAPQTVSLPTPLLASGYGYRAAPADGASVTIPNNVTNYILTPSGTLNTLTITMPSSPKHGQVLRLSSTRTVTALTLSGNSGQTISNTPTALTISTTAAYGYEFVYLGTVWYRTQ